MEEIVSEKKLEYLSHLTTHLQQNDERIRNEKRSLNKNGKKFFRIKTKTKRRIRKSISQHKKANRKQARRRRISLGRQ